MVEEMFVNCTYLICYVHQHQVGRAIENTERGRKKECKYEEREVERVYLCSKLKKLNTEKHLRCEPSLDYII